MDCSSESGFPDVIVTAEPPLRQDIALQLSRNPKVTFSIKCSNYNELVFSNRTVTVSAMINVNCV